jgi:ribonuclease HII
MKETKTAYLIGIDEAGRGPLAGPVAVGVVCVPRDFNWNLIEGVGDSKTISAKNREAIFCRAQELKKRNLLKFAVTLVSVSVIDKKGITHAVSRGIADGLRRLHVEADTAEVLLDGLLKAPIQYQKQKTIIRGDATEKVIGLASILAKVTRDQYMIRLSKRYPEYDFHNHKGYATKVHRRLVIKCGLSKNHRRTFCTKLSVHHLA